MSTNIFSSNAERKVCGHVSIGRNSVRVDMNEREIIKSSVTRACTPSFITYSSNVLTTVAGRAVCFTRIRDNLTFPSLTCYEIETCFINVFPCTLSFAGLRELLFIQTHNTFYTNILNRNSGENTIYYCDTSWK